MGLFTARNKKSPANSVPTLVCFILDESGSMNSVVTETLNGMEEYVESVRSTATAKAPVKFTLTKFNTTCTPFYDCEDIRRVEVLTRDTYTPHGCTALYDAVYDTIRGAEGWANHHRNGRVLCVIQTDGQENASRHYNQRDVADKISALNATGRWTFVFLGADQDAWATAKHLHIPTLNTFSYGSGDTSHMYSYMAAVTPCYLRSTATCTNGFFSQEDITVPEATKCPKKKKPKK
jgi:hypothetical protein